MGAGIERLIWMNAYQDTYSQNLMSEYFSYIPDMSDTELCTKLNLCPDYKYAFKSHF